jgi:macrodomain Ter protein organizer (MatP/YcbG family)
LHRQVNNVSYRNSINEHLSKELANKIIELIEDADGYKWNYNHLYTSKNNITYWYFILKKIFKHLNHINIQIHPNNEILLLWKDLIVEVL